MYYAAVHLYIYTYRRLNLIEFHTWFSRSRWILYHMHTILQYNYPWRILALFFISLPSSPNPSTLTRTQPTRRELLNDTFFGDFWSRVRRRTCAYPTIIRVYHRKKKNKNEEKTRRKTNFDMQPARFVGVSVRATGFWCLYVTISLDQHV